jgi:hypothetical protein
MVTRTREEGIAMSVKKYPYVNAWGINLGSFEYYRIGEAAMAAEDNVPEDVIYHRDFDRITQSERDDALEEEKNGTAVVLRDGDGKPYRVWHRVGCIRNSDTRARVTAMAKNLKAGKPARG